MKKLAIHKRINDGVTTETIIVEHSNEKLNPNSIATGSIFAVYSNSVYKLHWINNSLKFIDICSGASIYITGNIMSLKNVIKLATKAGADVFKIETRKDFYNLVKDYFKG